jgi:hypothetical protein
MPASKKPVTVSSSPMIATAATESRRQHKDACATKHKQNERRPRTAERLKAFNDDSKYALSRIADPIRPVPWRNQELCQP